ncbi:MAG: class F sortase [Patescibacteria group bacterium]
MKKILIILITIVATGVFSVTLAGSVLYDSSGEVSLPKNSRISTMKADLSTYPTHLSIPRIGVEAQVIQVGVTKKGNMATPRNFTDVGWYKYGTVPGQFGSAVIAGHLDNGLALPGVFTKLNHIQKGDDIYLTDGKNKVQHFVVTKTALYDFDASASEVFNNKNGKILNLITCAGNWMTKYKTHGQRLVVTSKLVE